MSERKVLNKYHPPDFDPAKNPRRSKTEQQQVKVRTMLPMSIRCGTCGTYIYKGTKFNARHEKLIGETYLGIPIFRSYIKCTNCSAEIVLKTDPRNSDYLVEAGARRNFEPDAEDEERQVGDAMEIRRLASKRETETLAALDELKSMKSRHARVSVDSMLEALQRPAPLQIEEGKQQLDVFQRSQRRHAHISVDSVLEALRPLQKQQLEVFQRSGPDDIELHKKRKAAYYHLSVSKKSSVAKAEEKSNGLRLLCQQYASIDD